MNIDIALKKCKILLNSILEKELLLDFDFERYQATLNEKNRLYRSELKNLQAMKKFIDEISYYEEDIDKIAFLTSNSKYKYIKYFNELNLPEVSLIMQRDIKKLITSYNKALKDVKSIYYTSNSGLKGESKVTRELERYSNSILPLFNINLEFNNEGSECDAIVIAETGIFCIEVKNFGAGKIIINNDGSYERYDMENNIVPTSNITAQVYKHISVLQNILNDKENNKLIKLPYYIQVYPIIVMANDYIKVENKSNVPIMGIENVYHYIMNKKTEVKVARSSWKTIEEIIINNNKDAKKYPLPQYYEKLMDNVDKLSIKIKKFLKVINSLKAEENLFNILFKQDLFYNQLLKAIENNNNKLNDTISKSHLICLNSLIDQIRIIKVEPIGYYEGILKYSFKKEFSSFTESEYEIAKQVILKNIKESN